MTETSTLERVHNLLIDIQLYAIRSSRDELQGNESSPSDTESALLALINKERKTELQQLLDDETKGATCICQQADTKVCDHNWSLCNVIRDRIQTLSQGGKK